MEMQEQESIYTMDGSVEIARDRNRTSGCHSWSLEERLFVSCRVWSRENGREQSAPWRTGDG